MFDGELEQVGLVLGLEPATTTEFRVLTDETKVGDEAPPASGRQAGELAQR